MIISPSVNKTTMKPEEDFCLTTGMKLPP